MGNANCKEGSDADMLLAGVSSRNSCSSLAPMDSADSNNMTFIPSDASPPVITPQVPQVPLAFNGIDELGRQWSCQLRGKIDEGPTLETTYVATLIQWTHGGSNVLVEGSWDNWSTRSPLHKANKDFTLVEFLPAGVYHYKFLVDGKSRHSPDLPFVYDDKGTGINILDVQDHVSEDLDSMKEFDAPLSPESSYDSSFPGPEDYSKDPPVLPPQLYLKAQFESYQDFNSKHGESLDRPQHVILNHLFMETRQPSIIPVLALGFTHRFRTKYVTVILHKPFQK